MGTYINQDLEQNQSLIDEIPYANTPKLVDCLSKHAIKKVSCGLNHAVAITKDSGLCYTWGCGSHGQLGRTSNSTLNLNPPQAVSFFVKKNIKVLDVAAGGKHTLFLTCKSLPPLSVTTNILV